MDKNKKASDDKNNIKQVTPEQWRKVKTASTPVKDIKACRCGGYGNYCPMGYVAGKDCDNCPHR